MEEEKYYFNARREITVFISFTEHRRGYSYMKYYLVKKKKVFKS